MKVILVLFGIILLSTSCDQGDEEVPGSALGLFELESMNMGLSGQIVEKEDLDFIETLQFDADSSFVKERIYTDRTVRAKGRFTSIKDNEFTYWKLNFEADSELIQNCGYTMHEYVRIINRDQLYNGSYLACDGPGYYYRRKE